jgi:hypothetical protein
MIDAGDQGQVLKSVIIAYLGRLIRMREVDAK